jgi:DNA-binding CsgD family transcriptional regulator
MKVRGIAVLTRKMVVTRRFGAEAWARFYADVASAHSCFRSLITRDTLIPLRALLAFNDEAMRRFFKNNDASHFELGRQNCQWALTEGPFRAFKEKEDLAGLVGSLPSFHRLYFADSATRSEAQLLEDGSGIEFKVFDLPEWHPYLEHCVTGYVAEVLEMFCANPIRAIRLQGGSGRGYSYLFRGLHPPSSGRPPGGSAKGQGHLTNRGERPPIFAPVPQVSDREMDVLLLIAHGKTNEEIGAALGISPKTAQHHVSRAYRKINVSGRVGAALWLAERGFIGR